MSSFEFVCQQLASMLDRNSVEVATDELYLRTEFAVELACAKKFFWDKFIPFVRH